MPEVPPPIRVASSTVTAAPACASRYATEAPIAPAPITIVFIIFAWSSFPQHCRDLGEAADARVHLHRLAGAVGRGGSIPAQQAFAHYNRGKMEVESLAAAGLDTTIGGPAANDDRVPPQHVQQLGYPRPIEGARPP